MHKKARGGTTLLAVSLSLVIVLLLSGLFFIARIMGGAREMRHATDSGALAVAKQILKRPGVPLEGNEQNQFAELVDPQTGQVNLLSYNRLIGHALLIALNAQAENTSAASQHAQEVIKMLQGSDGVGERLSQGLRNAEKTKDVFEGFANANPLRMLGNGSDVDALDQPLLVSFMSRGKASNVYINDKAIPEGAGFPESNLVSKEAGNGRRKYVRGYVPLLNGGFGQVLAVVNRPGEKPHLVSRYDFKKLMDAPEGIESTPPNAFQLAGSAEESKSGKDLIMSSAGIVGALSQDFPAEIPHGFIVLDNTGTATFNGNFGTGDGDIFATKLMQPNHIDVANGMFTSDPTAFADIKDFLEKNPGKTVPKSLTDRIDSPHTKDQVEGLKNATITSCDNVNLGVKPECSSMLPKMIDHYKHAENASGKGISNLMALELFKALVLEIRHNLPTMPGLCGTAYAPAVDTGLKQYNHTAKYKSIPFGSDGTLAQLLDQSNAAGAKQDIITRLYQMKPAASDAEINGVMNATVPFGKTSYIYKKDGALSVTQTPPPWPVTSDPKPDGTAHAYSSGLFNVNGLSVNVPGEQGYPNPWDCPAIPASAQDKCIWTPSTGYGQLLGVCKFKNSCSGGGKWCCPC